MLPVFFQPSYYPDRAFCHLIVRRAEGRCALWLEPYRLAESQRLCPLIGKEGSLPSNDAAFCLTLCSVISGAEGAVFSKSVETPHVRAEPFKELRWVWVVLTDQIWWLLYMNRKGRHLYLYSKLSRTRLFKVLNMVWGEQQLKHKMRQ